MEHNIFIILYSQIFSLIEEKLYNKKMTNIGLNLKNPIYGDSFKKEDSPLNDKSI